MRKLINGCNINVSQTTIDALIQIANNNPKVKYEFKYGINCGNPTSDNFRYVLRRSYYTSEGLIASQFRNRIAFCNNVNTFCNINTFRQSFSAFNQLLNDLDLVLK